jgi:hypothetical protein
MMATAVRKKKAYKVKRGLGLLRRPLDSHKQTFSGGHVPRCHREEQIKQLKKKKKVAAKAKRDKKKLASKIRKPYEAEKQNFLKQIKQLEEELESAACCQECGHLRLQLACERDTFVLHLQKCSTSLKELTLNEQCPTADRENDSQTSTGVGYDVSFSFHAMEMPGFNSTSICCICAEHCSIFTSNTIWSIR